MLWAAPGKARGLFYCDIKNGGSVQLLQELCTSQNIAMVAALLLGMPEPQDPTQRDLHCQVRGLLELAAVQQVERSSLHRHQAALCLVNGVGPQDQNHSALQPTPPPLPEDVGDAQAPAPASAPLPPRSPVNSRIGPNYDARSVIHGQQCSCHDTDVNRVAARAEDAHAYARIPKVSHLRQ